LIDNKI